MFEHEFKNQLAPVSTDAVLIEKLWFELKQHYSDHGRHYHTLTHLDNLLTELKPIQQDIKDWPMIVFSIAYHDAIYDPLKNDNEVQSARLAFERLSQLNIPDTKIDKCIKQILATRAHETSDDNDTNLFTDADLSILGATNEQYQQYADMIRKEYAVYPDLVYKPGRQNVLRHFLDMENIYKTEYFRGKYESRAKENLGKELKELVAW